MGFTTSGLIIGIIGGAFGMAYFVYGKRQQRLATMLAGVLLGLFPMFTDNTLALLVIGAALLAVPFVTDF